ncbi:hypothetical protein SY85_19255 [Flavisolibacter tropicus]|uniref:Uncharacterized protein n=1 Tax=Flavisolibacter tropicus TaxID=1492898 RepID=A0A172TYY1_9BACT|nr:hypothetical protein SY85_19255 [Flavisolibacter tropicus]
MSEKTFLRTIGFLTLLIVGTNLVYVPYLIKTTSGGKQAPLTFIVKSFIVWLIVSGIVLGIHKLSERK